MARLRRLVRGRARALVVATVLLSACGAGGDPSTGARAVAGEGQPVAAGATSPPAGSELDAAAVVQRVVEAGTPIGRAVETLDGRPAVAWFWAPWCTICRAEGPTVAEVAAAHAEDVVVFGVPGRGDADDMVQFIEDTGTGGLAHVADLTGEIWSAFEVYGQPAFAFIAADGTIDVVVGSLGERALTQRIAELVEA